MTETLGPYELLELLGKGGMGEVHLARDTKLQRQVALKLLPPDLADDPERRGRFLREARAAAALNHPNITTILDVGEENGRDYIAQEYLDGRPLSEIVAERKLPLAELATLAVPLADALAYAHEHGVIHRDLKAANVIVNSRGDPKLLDFGLAKVLHGDDGPAQGDDQSTTLTISGAVFGTPSAMSPEQALGKAVDARSDVFSFGALLYEMAAGKPAFLGATVQETMDKVLHARPEPLDQLRRDLPSDFAGIVEKALRKDPSERYQSMADLVADLRHFKRQTDSGLVPPGTGAFPAHRRRGLGWAVIVLVGVAVAIAAVWRPWETEAAPTTVAAPVAQPLAAVMYFENVNDADDADQLGRMLTHLVTTEVAAGGSVDMLSQQRLFDVARQTGSEDGTIDRSTASVVAREAGLATMILGRVVRVGSTITASTELVDVESGKTLGSFQAEGRGEDDLFAMARALGDDVRGALGPVRLTAAEKAALDEQRTSDVEAYRAYVRGREAMNRLDMDTAMEALREATRLDPAFAQAHFWLAIALGWGSTQAEQAAAVDRAKAYRERLPPELQPTLDAYDVFVSEDYEAALPILKDIVRRDPGNREAHYMLGEVYHHCAVNSDPRKAAEHFARVLEIDPGFRLIAEHLVTAYRQVGDWDAIHDQLEAWGDATPDSVRSYLGLVRGETDVGTDAATEDYYSLGRRVIGEQWDFAAAAIAAEPGDPVDLGDGFAPENFKAFLGSRSMLAMYRGHFARAEEGLRQLIAEWPELLASGGATTAGVTHRVDFVDLLRLGGRGDEARPVIDEVVRTRPDDFRALFAATRVAARSGDVAEAERHGAHLATLAEEAVSPAARIYCEAALAEIELASGRAEEAAVRLDALLSETPLCFDFPVAQRSHGVWFCDTLARARLAQGDTDGARQAWTRLVDAGLDRYQFPLLWVSTLYELGVLELESGHEAAGRALLSRFLEYWGEADWELAIVADAKARLD